MKWTPCEDPELPPRWPQPMEKCIQTRKHKYTFTTSLSSRQCNYSEKRLLFYRLENSAKITDILMSGSAVKEDSTIICKNGQLRASLFQGCHPVLVAVRRQHRHCGICLQQVQPKRRDGPAPGDWCGSPSKTHNKDKKRDGNRESDHRLRDLPEWLDEFTDNACTRTHFSRLRFGTSYESHIKLKEAQYLYSLPQRPKIAKSHCEPK